MILGLLKTLLGLVIIFFSLYLSVFVLVNEPTFSDIIHLPSLYLVLGTLIGVSFFLAEFGDYGRFVKFMATYNVSKEKKKVLATEKNFEKMLNVYVSEGKDAFANFVKENNLPYIWQVVSTKLQIQVPINDIKRILTYKIHNIVARLDQDITTVRQLTVLAPALGMLGTVLGLIRLLSNMKDFSTLGANMSLALVTTLYGIFLANIIFVPIARRIEKRKYMAIKNHENIIYWLSALDENKPSFYLKQKLRDMTDVG